MNDDEVFRFLDRRQLGGAITAMHWTTAGLAFGCDDGSRHVWRAGSITESNGVHRHGVRSIRMGPSETVASVDHDGWMLIDSPVHAAADVCAMEWTTAAGLVAACTAGVVCDAERTPTIVASGIGHPLSMAALGGAVVAIGTDLGLVWLDARIGGIDGRIDLAPVVAVASDPLGRFVVCGDVAGSLHVVGLATGRGSELDGYPDRVELIAIDAMGGSAVAASDDELTVWRLGHAGVVGDQPLCLNDHDNTIVVLAAEPCRPRIASGDLDGRIVVWSIPRGHAIAHMEVSSEVGALAWAPTGTALAIGTIDGRLHIVAL